MVSPLDVLLGAQIKDDGVAVTPRRYLDLRTGFTLTDDPATDSIRVSVTGGGGGVLVGDVNGDADDNVVTRITGDTGDVEMVAESLSWGSPGSSQLKVNAVDGAIELWNNAALALKAHGSAPTIANTGSITQIIGGVRHSVKTISGPVTLDATTKDFIGWVDASAPRTVTLPTPSAGRTFLLVNVGASAVTIARSGSELINGVAANYVVPVANCIVQIVSNGTDWFALPIFDGTGTYVTTARTINTTAPLTGGGNLSADRTLAVSDATTGAVGVVRLTGDLGGTGASPTVLGVTGVATTPYGATSKHAFKISGTDHANITSTGLRVGDGTTATQKLDVVGSETLTGFVDANSGGSKVRIGGLVGAEASFGALYLGAGTPDANNYTVICNGTTDIRFNCPSVGGKLRLEIAGTSHANVTSTGLRVGDSTTATAKLDVQGSAVLGTTTSAHQIIGSQRWTVRSLSANLVVDTTTTDMIILVDTSAARSITLPSATSGRILIIKDKTGSASTNNITITRAGSESIEGVAANYVFATDWGYLTLVCDGTNWFIVG